MLSSLFFSIMTVNIASQFSKNYCIHIPLIGPYDNTMITRQASITLLLFTLDKQESSGKVEMTCSS